MLMQSWRDNVRKVEPYVPGEQPKQKVIKLNTNENPYPPSPKVAQVLKNMDIDAQRRYPDPDCMSLRSALAEYYGFETENVFVGVGSDDVLSMAFMTFFNGKEPILFPDITYSFYSVWAELHRIPYETVCVSDDFRIPSESFFRKNGGIIFPNPNAPTAICEPLSFVRQVVEKNRDVVVIVDEAYIDFGGESALELTREYDNLLVVQTFSKSRSMAGMRIGFAIGNRELIQAMNDVKFSFNSYTMNQTALESGVAALKDDAYFKETTRKIIEVREKTREQLEKLSFTVTDSKTNFLFVTHKTKKASDLFRQLKEKNIYVRYFNLPKIDNYLRITIGTEEEMQALCAALEEAVG